ncbi:hypothetical protein Barb7_00293 [Bacteroidales bacterium Barb7]|nr:hypothetical protein Barb7_00293 [Bacteroidales bacterium Barb7]
MKSKIFLLLAVIAVFFTSLAVSCTQTDDVTADDGYSIQVKADLTGTGAVSFNVNDEAKVLNAFGDINVDGHLKADLGVGILSKTGEKLAELYKSNSIPELASASAGIKGTVIVILKSPFGEIPIYEKTF